MNDKIGIIVNKPKDNRIVCVCPSVEIAEKLIDDMNAYNLETDLAFPHYYDENNSAVCEWRLNHPITKLGGVAPVDIWGDYSVLEQEVVG